jgi:hypothetical protein
MTRPAAGILLTEGTVKGRHFVQVDSPDEIGHKRSLTSCAVYVLNDGHTEESRPLVCAASSPNPRRFRISAGPISTSRARRHWLHGRSACPLSLVAPLNSEALPVGADRP